MFRTNHNKKNINIKFSGLQKHFQGQRVKKKNCPKMIKKGVKVKNIVKLPLKERICFCAKESNRPIYWGKKRINNWIIKIDYVEVAYVGSRTFNIFRESS